MRENLSTVGCNRLQTKSRIREHLVETNVEIIEKESQHEIKKVFKKKSKHSWMQATANKVENSRTLGGNHDGLRIDAGPKHLESAR